MVVFILFIAFVPVSQTALELWRGERVQFTDVFGAPPTSASLREYERTLEANSWVQQRARPLTRRALFEVFREMGGEAVPGRNGWLFYRPDIRYLVEPDRPESDGPGRWARPKPVPSRRDGVLAAVVSFNEQLRKRGIELVVVPVPGKPAIYPEHLTRRARGGVGGVASPTEPLLAELARRGVTAVDLFRRFHDERRTETERPLYLRHDTHWTPFGAQIAAEAVAETLRKRGWVPSPNVEFQVATVPVLRWGDVAAMTQLPELRERFGPEEVTCLQVRHPVSGLMVPGMSDRPGTYRAAGGQAKVLLLGDSFSRVYQYLEPRSLGKLEPGPAGDAIGTVDRRVTRALLPGSAGFPALLARALRAPVDTIVSDGGAATEVRQRLSTNPEILEGKQVVVWQFVERDLALGAAGWEDVPLPRRLD